jgi:GWxTD domain-containing protein
MSVILLFLAAVEWQSTINPLTDSTNELAIFFRISKPELKYTLHDSLYFASYEIQLKILDRRGEQLAGDYWQRDRREDSADIADSVRILIPSEAASFDLRIIDLQAYDIVRITEKIKPAKFLGNLRWWTGDDTLRLTFTVFNAQGMADLMTATLAADRRELKLNPGVYRDSLFFPVQGLVNDEYAVKMEIFKNTRKEDQISLPVRVARPFFLDEKTWNLKVSQLEYIATSSEIGRLRAAKIEDRDSLWGNFWKQYDPTPNTLNNEKEAEYFDRINYCEEHFGHGDKGWRSDRAKIYVKYGTPDEVQSMPYELGTFPYEVWFYYKLNVKFYFVDRNGLGEYLLTNSEGYRI